MICEAHYKQRDAKNYDEGKSMSRNNSEADGAQNALLGLRSELIMSMVDPSIDYLAEKVDSKYTLVILAAKRARELTKPGVNSPEKEVSVALKEIAADKITYERTKNV